MPVRTSHSAIDLSADDETTVAPSGLKVTPIAQPLWPLKVARRAPVAMSHTRTERSPEAEASDEPSGLKHHQGEGRESEERG